MVIVREMAVQLDLSIFDVEIMHHWARAVATEQGASAAPSFVSMSFDHVPG